MDLRNLGYLAADRPFFDSPDRAPQPPSRLFVLPHQYPWSTWLQHSSRSWHAVSPGVELPVQGWKIHVSATPANAQSVLSRVAEYAWDARLSFKFIPDHGELIARNSKQAHRGSAGKFITLYPRDEAELERSLDELERRVGGEPGPYILSDLRWKDGPLYVRYGAFHQRFVPDYDGELQPAVTDPSGALVPDIRSAGFLVPSWAHVPGFLQEQQQTLAQSEAPADFPYEVSGALHFSNGGGVYLARAHGEEHETIVLKEGRPHAGLTPDGRDAVMRLDDEASYLEWLRDEPTVVALHERRRLGEHGFLVLERIEGKTLSKQVVERYPGVRVESTPADYLDYRDWALSLVAVLEAAITRIHEAGVAVGDIHPENILVREDDSPVLIDLEMAHPVDDGAPNQLGAPGFAPPTTLAGREADLWSLARVELFLFMPHVGVADLDVRKTGELIDTAASAFMLPPEFVEHLRRRLVPPEASAPMSRLAQQAIEVLDTWNTRSEDGLIAIQVMLARAIESSADFARTDRAYPGDPQQFRDNGYNLAHGAAGVIHALSNASLDVPADAWDWLDNAIRMPSAPAQLGLFDGLSGVGWALRTAGDHAWADRVLAEVIAAVDQRLDRPDRPLRRDLYGGLPGIGLYLLSEGQDVATELATRIAARLDGVEPALNGTAEPRHGLMRGPSGTALFAARLFELTGQPEHLRLAETAFAQDRAHLVEASDGSLQMDEGYRLMPYLASGSGGCALVAAQLLDLVADPEPYLAIVNSAQLALQSTFTIESGLFTGRAGFIHILGYLSRLGLTTPESERALDAHVAALKLHAVRLGTGIGFPGTSNLRLSTDFATGAAGVVSALQSYELLRFAPEWSGWEATLPLLAHQSTRAARRAY